MKGSRKITMSWSHLFVFPKISQRIQPLKFKGNNVRHSLLTWVGRTVASSSHSTRDADFRWYVHLPLKSSRLSCLDIIVLGLPISAIMTSKELRHRFRKFRVQILNGKKQV